MYVRVNVAVAGKNMWFVVNDGAMTASLIDVFVDARPHSACCHSISLPDRNARLGEN